MNQRSSSSNCRVRRWLRTRVADTMPETVQTAITPSVFVVDDEPSMRMLARAFLQKGGFNVVDEAEDGPQALERFHDLNPPPVPSVVLLDNRMPGLTGLEVAEQMLTQHPSQVIVLFSAHLDDFDRSQGTRHRHRRVRLEDGRFSTFGDHPHPPAAGLRPPGADRGLTSASTAADECGHERLDARWARAVGTVGFGSAHPVGTGAKTPSRFSCLSPRCGRRVQWRGGNLSLDLWICAGSKSRTGT